MSRFFINRPIVAIVIALLTVIVGAITIVALPVSLFRSDSAPRQRGLTAAAWDRSNRGAADRP